MGVAARSALCAWPGVTSASWADATGPSLWLLAVGWTESVDVCSFRVTLRDGEDTLRFNLLALYLENNELDFFLQFFGGVCFFTCLDLFENAF